MAHPNIEERRAKVRQLLEDGTTFSPTIKSELAREFRCSPSAIHADLIEITRTTTDAIYVTASMRKRVYERDGNICQYCGRTEACEHVVEHVIPAANGGVAKLYNLVVSCQSCNKRKGRTTWIPINLDFITKDYPEWRSRVLAAADR